MPRNELAYISTHLQPKEEMSVQVHALVRSACDCGEEGIELQFLSSITQSIIFIHIGLFEFRTLN